jgi:urease accessory protein
MPNGELIINTESLLQLQRLLSPNLPIGAFSFSQGLEGAVTLGWVSDAQSLSLWCMTLLEQQLAFNEGPLMVRMLQALECGDLEAFSDYDAWLLSLRETSELLAEELQMGRALLKLACSLHPDIRPPASRLSYLASLCWYGHFLGLSAEALVPGFMWSWCENQVLAATRLIKLGHVECQQILSALIPMIAVVAETSRTCEEGLIGQNLPGLFLASAAHEQQYSRLFRS